MQHRTRKCNPKRPHVPGEGDCVVFTVSDYNSEISDHKSPKNVLVSLGIDQASLLMNMGGFSSDA